MGEETLEEEERVCGECEQDEECHEARPLFFGAPEEQDV